MSFNYNQFHFKQLQMEFQLFIFLSLVTCCSRLWDSNSNLPVKGEINSPGEGNNYFSFRIRSAQGGIQTWICRLRSNTSVLSCHHDQYSISQYTFKCSLYVCMLPHAPTCKHDLKLNSALSVINIFTFCKCLCQIFEKFSKSFYLKFLCYLKFSLFGHILSL